MKGLGGMPPVPLNAPQGAALTGGVQPGQSSGIVTANKVIVFGPGDGVFVYSGAPPAAGNLIASIAPAAGTDPYGNHYVAGDASYSATFATALNGGQVTWYTGSLATGWSVVATATSHAVAPQGLVILSAAEIALSLSGGGTAGLFLGTAVSPNIVNFTGNVVGLNTGVPGSAGTQETWHPMTPLLNSWAAQAAPNVQPQYRAVAAPINCIEVIGSLNAAAATAITFFTLPAGYRPASSQPFPVGTFSGTTGITNVTFGFCDTSGNLTIQQRSATQTGIYFHGLIALDA